MTVCVCVGVALLPFVDERRLRAALAEVYPNLSPEESKYCPLKRNYVAPFFLVFKIGFLELKV